MAEDYIYEATPEMFAVLGILDDAYYAYERIMDIYNEIIDSSENIILGINDKCRPQVKKILNAFFEKHTSVFCDKPPILYINNTASNWLRFIGYKNLRSTNKPIEYVRESFCSFIKDLELIAARAIFLRELKHHPRANFQTILDNMNNRLLLLSSKAWKERKITLMPDEFVIPSLYVFKSLSQVSCYKNAHSVVTDKCIIPLIGNSNQGVIVPIHKCETCGRKFIGYESYKQFVHEYGHMIFERKLELSESSDRYMKFAIESKLHSLGYNVVDGELSENERHKLLLFVLKNHIMTYLEICRDIENAIGIFDGRKNFIVACKKWRDDLLFIGNYVIDKSSL